MVTSYQYLLYLYRDCPTRVDSRETLLLVTPKTLTRGPLVDYIRVILVEQGFIDEWESFDLEVVMDKTKVVLCYNKNAKGDYKKGMRDYLRRCAKEGRIELDERPVDEGLSHTFGMRYDMIIIDDFYQDEDED